MDCGAASTWHIPGAEHRALHECSCLEIQVNSIENGSKVSLPAKVILTTIKAMQVVSVAQSLA
jgi:hypothetical protein